MTKKKQILRITLIALSLVVIGALSYKMVGNSSDIIKSVVIKNVTLSSRNADNEMETPENFHKKVKWDTYSYAKAYEDIGDPIKIRDIVKGAIVPKDKSGFSYTARFFDSLSDQSPELIVLLAQDETDSEKGRIYSSNLYWKNPFGNIYTDRGVLRSLTRSGIVHTDDEIVFENSAIKSVLPFVRFSTKESKVLPIVVDQNIDEHSLRSFAKTLNNILPKKSVVVAVADMSHNPNTWARAYHNEYCRSIIRNLDYSRAEKLDSGDSVILKTFMMTMDILENCNLVYEISGGTSEYFIPYFSKGTGQKENMASILHFGDLMIDRYVKTLMRNNGEDYIFQKIADDEKSFFRGMDIVEANLEGPFANSRYETSKEIAFRFDPADLDMLANYNFSLFNLANNHTFDMGTKGEEENRANLEERGVEYYGKQYSIGEESVIIKNISGMNVAFVGFNDTNSWIDTANAVNIVNKAGEDADKVVVNVHWGKEYDYLNSSERQQGLAHSLIDAGADIIIGHHPHVIQEIEIYNDKPIFYSLGNFIFDQYMDVKTKRGLAIGTIFYDNKTSIYVFPFHSELSQPELMDASSAKVLMDEILKKSRLGKYKFNGWHLNINSS